MAARSSDERDPPRRRRHRILVAGSIALALASTGLVPAPRALEADEDGAYVYRSWSLTSRHVGRIDPGGPVMLRACDDQDPTCESHAGFVPVEPFGFMIGRNLRPRQPVAPWRSRSLARIQRATDVRARADGSGRLRRLRAGHSVALVASTIRAPFAERPNGTFIDTADITVHRPSALVGERNPTTTIAFVIRETRLADGTTLRHYDRRAVESSDATEVRVRGGVVPRDAVRLASRRTRPSEVPADAFWVHVDVAEQTLTAYRGDAWVLSTLVTTGALQFPTPRGTYRVHQKTRSMTMEGDEPDNYLVEEVEHVQFFNSGYALHSAYWHDHFGERGSHGCVNLAPADARFLFDWAPPTLPEGWATIYPRYSGLDRLWITVE